MNQKYLNLHTDLRIGDKSIKIGRTVEKRTRVSGQDKWSQAKTWNCRGGQGTLNYNFGEQF